jgi:hypothetical protein
MPRPLRRVGPPGRAVDGNGYASPSAEEIYDALDEPDLNAQHAIIITAAIDVMVMRLDGKQMTLSVFRQLGQASIFDGAGRLLGEPWGRVNYTWDKAVAWADYYVVWQEGEHLRRMPVPLCANLGGSYKEPRSGRWVERAHGLLHWLGTPNAHNGMMALPELMVGHLREFEALDQLFIAV